MSGIHHPSVDPAGLKPQLGLLAYSVYFGLWCESKYKNKILIGNHDIQEWSKHDVTKAYGFSNVQGYDGVHLFGQLGKRILTRSIVKILKENLSSTSHATNPTVSSSNVAYDPMTILRERIHSHRSTSTRPYSPVFSKSHPPPTVPPPSLASARTLLPRIPVIKTLRSAIQDQYNISVSNQFETLGN